MDLCKREEIKRALQEVEEIRDVVNYASGVFNKDREALRSPVAMLLLSEQKFTFKGHPSLYEIEDYCAVAIFIRTLKNQEEATIYIENIVDTVMSKLATVKEIKLISSEIVLESHPDYCYLVSFSYTQTKNFRR